MNIRPLLLAMVISLTLPAIGYSQAETPLLPEVKKILEVPVINEVDMDQNAYVYLMAIDAKDDHYFSIAKQYLQKRNQELIASFKKPNESPNKERVKFNYSKLTIKRMVNGKNYISPCLYLSNQHCIEDTLKDKQQIAQLITANKVLLDRYQKIISLPTYHSYDEVGEIYINYLYSWLSYLQQFQAIASIEKGDIAHGLKLIQQEIDFAKKILSSDSPDIDKAVAARQLLTLYHTVSDLLDSPLMAQELNNPSLKALLRTLPEQTSSNLKAMVSEVRNRIVYYMITDISFMGTDYDKKIKQLSIDENIPLVLDLNKTLNDVYQNFMPLLLKVDQFKLPEASAYYLKMKNKQDKEIMDLPYAEFKTAFLKKYGKDNLLGNYVIEIGISEKYISDSVFRLYNASNYLALVRLKLEMKQAHIKADQVPGFLKKAGGKAINPYTQQPFVWNKEQQTLSTDWLCVIERCLEFYGDKLSVQINNIN